MQDETRTTARTRRGRVEDDSGIRRIRFSPWAAWLYGLPAVALLGGVLHLMGFGPFHSLTETLEREQQLREEIIQLKNENGALQEEIDSLMPDKGGIEKRAREQLRWSKPGEIVIHIPDKR